MADRTERERLVEVIRLAEEAASKAAWMLDHGATNENANLAHTVLALQDLLAAADLLSVEGEPDCYLVEIQRLDGEWVRAPRPFGTDPRFNDRREAMAEAEAYRTDGTPVRVRALYSGPVLPTPETVR